MECTSKIYKIKLPYNIPMELIFLLSCKLLAQFTRQPFGPEKQLIGGVRKTLRAKCLTRSAVCTYTVFMKNITLSIEDDLLKMGREYAKIHNLSFNVLVRKLIEQTVKSNSSTWIDDTFDYIDKNITSSQGITWKREDLYRG